MMHSKIYHFNLFLACFSLTYSIFSSIYVSMPNVFPVLHSGLQFILITSFISLILAVQLYLDIWVIYLMIFAIEDEDEDLDDDDDDTEEEPDQLEAVATTESETQKGN